MGVVKTVKGEDDKPYISLEDLIKEIESVKKSVIEEYNIVDSKPNFIDVVLNSLHKMEIEYYEKFIFRKKN